MQEKRTKVNEEKTILVVDDDHHIRLMLSRVLEEMDFTVETVANGKDALKKIRQHPCHLMLLDLNLPGMDGLAVLRCLHKEQIPARCIVITAYGTIERAVEAMRLGAADFVQKPFEPDDIRSIVTRTLSRKRSWTEKQYQQCLKKIREYLRIYHYEKAHNLVQRALTSNPDRVEVYNLLGVLLELRGQTEEAQKLYRAALGVEPTYQPAADNLDRISCNLVSGKLNLGD